MVVSCGAAEHAPRRLPGVASRPTSAASVPTLPKTRVLPTSSSASGFAQALHGSAAGRPGSAAHSEAASGVGVAPAAGWVRQVASGMHGVRPSTALPHQAESRLGTHAVPPARTHGAAAEAPPHATKPRRPVSAAHARATIAATSASHRPQTSQRDRSAPQPAGALSTAAGLGTLAEGLALPLGGAAGQKEPPRVVRVRRPSGKPFSNYQKYEAMKSALRGHTPHVTSVGPYVSRLEQASLDEQDRRARSIHAESFKPGGLWDKYEPPPGGWGFAAAGFLLPDDLPPHARAFGSFYNVHAHQHRFTRPKENLYM